MSTAVVNSFNATNWRCQSRRIPRTDNSSTSHPRSAAMTPCGTARPQVRQHEAQRGLKHRRLGRAAGEPAEHEHLRHVPALENQSRRFAFPAGVVSPVLPRRAERLEAHLAMIKYPTGGRSRPRQLAAWHAHASGRSWKARPGRHRRDHPRLVVDVLLVRRPVGGPQRGTTGATTRIPRQSLHEQRSQSVVMAWAVSAGPSGRKICPGRSDGVTGRAEDVPVARTVVGGHFPCGFGCRKVRSMKVVSTFPSMNACVLKICW